MHSQSWKSGLLMLTLAALGIFGAQCQAQKSADKTTAKTPSVTKIRFYPRADFPAAVRMWGGKFQGSNDKEGWTDLATIADKPAEAAWTELAVSGAAFYRYLCYLAPPRSFGNVAEIEFYAGAKKLTGIPCTVSVGQIICF